MYSSKDKLFSFLRSLNMDETRVVFHSGCVQVFSRPGVKHTTLVNESNKSSCTCVFTISAAGEVLPVMVVQKNKKPSRCGEVNSAKFVQTVFLQSNAGWMNSGLMERWSDSLFFISILYLYFLAIIWMRKKHYNLSSTFNIVRFLNFFTGL